MKIFVLFVTTQLLTQVGFAQVSAKDERFEERLARINEQFNQSEISSEEWQKVVGDKAKENYVLQDGDTLWDISEKFFGNGFYWAKIWQLNDKITNPHMIKAGDQLSFSSGSDVSAPELDVEQNGVEMNMSDDGDVDDTVEIATQDATKEIVIPKGRSEVEPLSKIPSSFPEWREMARGTDVDFASDTLPSKKQNYAAQSYIEEIIADGPWASVGKVVEMEQDRKTVATTYQNIFVTLDEDLNKGETFTVFKNGKTISDKDTDKELGTQVDIKGLLVIKKPIEGTPHTYVATVQKTISPIEVGDQLVAGNYLIKASFEEDGEPSVVGAKIVDGNFTNRRVFGLHQIVFLDKGEKEGLQNNSILDVVKNFSAQNSDSIIKRSDEVIGKLKVVNVGQNVATAVIIKSKDAIRTGDQTSMSKDASSDQEEIPDLEVPQDSTDDSF